MNITPTDIETAAAKIGNSAAGLIESHSREIADAIKKCAEASDSNKPFALAIAVRIGRNSDNGKINVMTPHTFPFQSRPQLRFDGLQSDGRGGHLHCWTDMGIGASFNTKSAGKREVFKAHDRKRIQFGVRSAK